VPLSILARGVASAPESFFSLPPPPVGEGWGRGLREGKRHLICTNGERTIPVKRHRILDSITTNQLCKQAGVQPKF